MILRLIVLGLGVLSLGGGIVVSLCGGPALIPPIVIGSLLVLGVLFERIVYKPVDRVPPGPDWRATAEIFVDPTTGERLTVFVKPATGERRYVGQR